MIKKSKLVCGIGVNDADYPVYITENAGGRQKNLWRCPFYQAWVSMLTRCYSPIYKSANQSYIGCSVTPEWLSFSAFRAWMVTQDHEGKQLDKDILTQGNRVYSPDSCVFVSQQLNSFLTDSRVTRGEWPIGVSWNATSGNFQARCWNPLTGKQENLGRFTDPAKAHEAWRAKKHEHALRYADQQTDLRIAQALRQRYSSIN